VDQEPSCRAPFHLALNLATAEPCALSRFGAAAALQSRQPVVIALAVLKQ
jgi:hypothetical protein